MGGSPYLLYKLWVVVGEYYIVHTIPNKVNK
nr:MAG TPA: hypothetical protein [Caudoviricetes sp.]